MQWQTNVVKFCKVCASAWNLGPLCYVRCYISSSACTSYAYTSRPNQWSALQLALHMRMCPDQTNGQLFCLHFICVCVQTKPIQTGSQKCQLLNLCCCWTCHQQWSHHCLGWGLSNWLQPTAASTMCAGGMAHQESAPPSESGAWKLLPSIWPADCTRCPWHQKCVLEQFPAKTLNWTPVFFLSSLCI